MNASTETILKDNLNIPEKVIELEKAEPKPNRLQKWMGSRRGLLVNCFVLFVATVYLIWASIYYKNHSVPGLNYFNSTTCNGYGFLVILYCLYLYGFSYAYVVKPIFLPLIFKHVWQPVASALDNIKYGAIIFYISLLMATIAYLVVDTNDNRNRLIPISGLCVFVFIGYLCCPKKSAIPWRTIIWGVLLQFVFGLLTIRWKVGRNILECFGNKVDTLLNYGVEGAAFTYGDFLVNEKAVFVFRSLSAIYFLSLLVNIFYHYGVMQKVVGVLGHFLQWIMGTTICESVGAAANIFLGQTESPLLLSPYLKDLTDSEIHSLMTSGFASVAGSLMAAYINYGARPQDLIASCIMTAPAALCFSKLMYPETEDIKVHRENIHEVENKFDSVMDAASKGALIGIKMVHGIVASLIGFLAFVYMINGILGWFGGLVGYSDPQWSLELIMGKIFIPVSYVMGVPWDECEYVANLIGIKTMVNEFVAFERMKRMLDENLLSPRTKVIATYAICGFSNPGSIGIMISGLGALMPSKREVITRLVMTAFFGGALACLMTACIAGTLMPDDVVM